MRKKPIHDRSKGNVDRKKVRKIYRKRVYYSFLTFVLVICLFQTVRGAYLNIAKYITLNQKLGKLEKIKENALKKNAKLKNELENYTSYEGIEELARNNLNMAGENEILVVIKKPSLEE